MPSRVLWPTKDAYGVDEFSDAVAKFASSARDRVEGRITRAQIATSLAVLATAAAIFSAVLKPHRSTAVEANVLLSPAGVSAVSRLCSHPSNVIRGSIEPEALGKSTITVTTAAGRCGPKKTTLNLLGRDVVAIARLGRLATLPVQQQHVQVELTPHGRLMLRERLGLRCHEDDLRGLVVAGPSSAPTVLAFARAECRRLRVHITPALGTVYVPGKAQ